MNSKLVLNSVLCVVAREVCAFGVFVVQRAGSVKLHVGDGRENKDFTLAELLRAPLDLPLWAQEHRVGPRRAPPT